MKGMCRITAKDKCVDLLIAVLKILGNVILWIAIVCIISIAISSRQSPDAEWNNGICPECGVRYEMKGVSMNLKYYVCPECGKEVERY